MICLEGPWMRGRNTFQGGGEFLEKASWGAGASCHTEPPCNSSALLALLAKQRSVTRTQSKERYKTQG